MIFESTDYTDFAAKEIHWEDSERFGFSTRSVGVTLAVAFNPRKRRRLFPSARQATLFSYRASEKSRIAVWGPAGNWVSTSDRGWRVPIYLFLSLPADAFSHAYSLRDYTAEEFDRFSGLPVW